MGSGMAEVLKAIPPPDAKPHVVMVSGKGGVGKTTVSIMLGLVLAERGDTLVESLDQAKHLLEYLSLSEVNREFKVFGRLSAMQFDTGVGVSKLGREYVWLMQRIMPGLKVLNAESVLDMVRNAPGLEEEVYLREVLRLYSYDRYDYIVVDTPPTGLTLRILNLPRLYKFWVERLISLRERIVSLRYVIARSLGQGDEVLDDPVLYKLKEIGERYAVLERELLSPNRTTFVLVSTPEPLPVYEAEKTTEFLKSLGSKPGIIVANRIIPEDIASKLGVREIQERALSKLRKLDCRRPCAMVEIPMVDSVPSSLDSVKGLLSKARIDLYS
ncbi:MAG: ArsA family ATPase [Aeropyrum sp.]|nr:ArsA family ATPase [Aeropyrum sp.]MCE4616111.1 ArsA family ATPase [Aeropyrum sp.]